MEDDSLKYITTDAAPAGVGKVLAANPGKMGRVVINSDEAISVLERIVSASAMNDVRFFLQGWDTEECEILNSQISATCYRLAVVMHIYTQPDGSTTSSPPF